jgi:hypothetical protein
MIMVAATALISSAPNPDFSARAVERMAVASKASR